MVASTAVEDTEGRTAHNNGWNGVNGMLTPQTRGFYVVDREEKETHTYLGEVLASGVEN